MPGRRAPTPRRYAQAIFLLALEHGDADRWRQDLQTMVDVTRSQGVAVLLESPGLKQSKKLATVRQVLPDLSPMAANFMALLAQRRALLLLPRVQAVFQDMLDQHEGRVRAMATTAIPLQSTERDQVLQRLRTAWQRDIVLESQVDPAILGGLIVRVGDHVIDGSTRGRLQSMRRTLREQSL